MSSHTEAKVRNSISAFFRSTKPQSSLTGLAAQPSKPNTTEPSQTSQQHSFANSASETQRLRPQTPPNQTSQDPATQVSRQPHTTRSQDSPRESPPVTPRSLLSSFTPRSLRLGLSRQTSSPQTTRESRSQSESSKTTFFSQIAVSVASRFEAARAARAAKRAQRQALRARRARELRERHFINFVKKVRAQEDIKTDGDEARKFVFTPDEYESLCLRIEQIDDDSDDEGKFPSLSSYFRHELRYEYSPTENELLILMPSEIHEIFSGHFTGELIHKLKCVAKNLSEEHKGISNELRKAAAKIRPQASTKLSFYGKGPSRKEPDAAYYYKDCTAICKKELPTLALEINWSRFSATQLAERAKSLINLSHGQIRTVITVDLHQIYKKTSGAKPPKKLCLNDEGPAPATVTVWRLPKEDDDERHLPTEEVFRDETGHAVDSFNLELSLCDFICERWAADLPGCDDVKITFTSEELCEMYMEAVEKHELTEDNNTAQVALEASGTMQPEVDFFKAVRRKSKRLAGKRPD